MGNLRLLEAFTLLPSLTEDQDLERRCIAFCLSSNEQCNIQTFTHVCLKDHHENNGFQTGWMLQRYQFTASRAVEGLASCQLPPSVKQILPASQVDFEKVFAYSADMLGSSQTCKLLLAAWLCHLQESSWAAIDKNGEMVGYLIMSETICFPQQANYYIAPLGMSTLVNGPQNNDKQQRYKASVCRGISDPAKLAATVKQPY